MSINSRWSPILLTLIVGAFTTTPAAEVSYNRHIRPLLSDNCFACHGPDEAQRKAKLRLDVREEAITRGAIVPGKPEESELVARIFTKNPEDLMPPADSHKVLSERDKQLLREWIAAGAAYEKHWAYIPPAKPEVPAGANGIDYLVEKRLQGMGLEFSPEAERRVLTRRLYFDLIGLPPTPQEVQALEQDESSNAYEKHVEHLLAMPQYGERMAIPWLDVVRFADTIGYHSDNPRNIWPYRDYVIHSFNRNKPFDQFTREQIAGDLLPESTLEQKVGSAFNRLLLSTEEGGAQAKDYEARMLTDRVRAVGTVWLGQTIGCAQCHDHKFDPITMRDFYSMGAFFADIKEPIIGRREEGMLVPTDEQSVKLAKLSEEAKTLQQEFDGPHDDLKDSFARWQQEQRQRAQNEQFWRALKPGEAKSAENAKLEVRDDGIVFARGQKPDKDTYTVSISDLPNPLSALRIEALPHDSLPSKGAGRADNGNFVITEVLARVKGESGTRELKLSSARADFEQSIIVDENPYKAWTAASAIDGDAKGASFGWAVLPEITSTHFLVLELAEPVKLEQGDSLEIEIQQKHGGAHTLGQFRLSGTSSYDVARGPVSSPLPKELEAILLASGEPNDEQKQKLFAHFKTVAPELAELRQKLASAQKEHKDYEASIPRCLVSISSDQPRTVRILPRGNWMSDDGEAVKPALPGYLVEPGENQKELNRLDLANWLISRENPLTARVVMNRLWKQFFGTGLSKVLDDLGAQGEPPVNPELLDWLACEFMDSGWDMKHMVRLIVSSRTYRQSSIAPEKLRELDPYNRELAAQSRWRLDAELVRDNALAISGLLVKKIGGPSAKPYQPEGYWENLNFPVRTYDASKGEDQYRRGLYTWWQRSYLHPSMVAFDAPSREECAAERNRSNIPQQALVLLNDPTYVEASRAFAVRILKEGGSSLDDRITWAWKQALARAPRTEELATVRELVAKHLAEYRDDQKAAEALLEVGLSSVPEGLDKAELAAWTNAARVILNLHETITRS